ncbi:MAG: peptidylprolyl isomerase [Bacteroidia bacterium]|nr:peptidylprolyl isomerase [Bacteroidia bacterium]
MKGKIYLLIVSLCFFSQCIAQNNDNAVLLTVDGKPVTKAEFERIYHKNNTNATTDAKSLDDYLDLFINFKLKVTEAMKQGLDTTKSFTNELSGYRKQLAKPYLVDPDADDKILHQAYDRMKEEIKCSHILLEVKPDAKPEDTLAAYNKILKIRDRLIKGEDFEKVAKEVSDDKSVSKNGGNIGYFAGFQMVFPFEDAAYKLNTGEISAPVRTRYGYHLIKLTDRRQARGQVKVGHIMITVPADSSDAFKAKAKARIFEVYDKLKKGGDFAKLALEYSDDKNSAKKGGELPMFGTGRMVPEFEEASFALKNIGDYSEPVKTDFGWHIIRLIDKQPLGSFEDIKHEIKSKLSKDLRGNQSRTSLVNKLKKEYAFTEIPKPLSEFYTAVDDSILKGRWNGESAKNLKGTLFSFAGKTLNKQDFVEYLVKNKTKTVNTSKNDFLNDMYKRFTEETFINYEDSRLEDKYPEFRYLMSEYHDGILLFELTDRMVWSKAVKDSTGLQAFYDKNKNNYKWSDRVNSTIFLISPAKSDTGKIKTEISKNNAKALDKISKLIEKRYLKDSDDEITKEANNIIIKCKSDYVFTATDYKYSKGDNPKVDSLKWKPGIYPSISDKDKKMYIVIKNSIPPEIKTLKEAKGLVTADYQTFLESEWIKELRTKYKVTVDKSVLSTIK